MIDLEIRDYVANQKRLLELELRSEEDEGRGGGQSSQKDQSRERAEHLLCYV